jgi:hypothetical protein
MDRKAWGVYQSWKWHNRMPEPLIDKKDPKKEGQTIKWQSTNLHNSVVYRPAFIVSEKKIRHTTFYDDHISKRAYKGVLV